MRLKKSLAWTIGLLMGIVCFATAAQKSDLRLEPTDRILILAPHPDDEMLCCGGVIQEARANHIPLKIVFLTYGDFDKWAFSIYSHSPVFRPKTMLAMGEVRRKEALTAAQVLGVAPDALIFLGYPDYGTLAIWNAHGGSALAYQNPNTKAQAVPYATAYRPHAPYKKEEILRDLKTILQDFSPTKVFVSHPADRNVDHRALYLFLHAALKEANQMPAIYTYLIHFPKWPKPRGLHESETLTPPRALTNQKGWEDFPLSVFEVRMKYSALEKHRTQTAYSNRFMTSFVKSNELFSVDVSTAKPSD